jgi:GH25 family lysozyme M1 (1,4-beta-N-acetylmuramidase)
MKNKLYIIIIIFLTAVISTLLALTWNKKLKAIQKNTNETNQTVNKKEEEKKETKKEKKVIENLTYEFNTKVFLKDVENITVDDNTTLIDTGTLGNNTYEDDNYIIKYNIKDTKKPIIIGSSSITIYNGSSTNPVNKLMCGDNETSKPNCYIDGNWNVNKNGTYEVKYTAIDNSGNKSTKDIKIVVKNKPKDSSKSSSSSTKKGTKLAKFIEKYKTDDTLIGIDVSAWQGNIDFSKAKKDGVEAAIIRLGYGPSGDDRKLKLDSKFKRNLEGFKKVGIPVGIYYFSYAKTKEEVKNTADYIIKNLDGATLDFPIAFDWENWGSSFNKYGVSFKDLGDMYQIFKKTLNDAGYKTMLYSSAYYLNKVWDDRQENSWVAYYTSNNDFKKEYMMWQATSKGKVSGISGPVDINIIYNNKIK